MSFSEQWLYVERIIDLSHFSRRLIRHAYIYLKKLGINIVRHVTKLFHEYTSFLCWQWNFSIIVCSKNYFVLNNSRRAVNLSFCWFPTFLKHSSASLCFQDFSTSLCLSSSRARWTNLIDMPLDDIGNAYFILDD